jgi:dTDP-4-amino-4,6-dideoxygalactose transaminase
MNLFPAMTATKTQIPYIDLRAQYVESHQEILQAIEKVLAGGHYILGRDVEDFEQRFAKLCGTQHAIGVANGTDALILALKALGIGAGDEVITVSNSFIASASSVALTGGRPVFVDVREDLNMDPDLIERAITPRTRAILPVHLTGKCAAMDEILNIAQKHRLHVIEDAAQSVGATYKNRKSGSFGIIGCFSLHPLKNLNAVGDAGILTTNDDFLNDKLRLLRNHGLKNRDEVSFWGYNSRLDTLQAAVLNGRFQQLDKVIKRRRQIAQRYTSRLSPWVACPQESSDEYHTYHVYVIQANQRDELKKHLADQGIDTRIHYPIPIHLQACCSELGYNRGDFPVCEKLAGKILSLPVHQFLTDEQVETICKSIANFYQRAH